MKNKFNFLQIANWLYICRTNLEKIKSIENREQAKQKLFQEINKLKILIEILSRKKAIHGINPEFLKNLKQIKKDYGILE